jgi:hypothetical protein
MTKTGKPALDQGVVGLGPKLPYLDFADRWQKGFQYELDPFP